MIRSLLRNILLVYVAGVALLSAVSPEAMMEFWAGIQNGSITDEALNAFLSRTNGNQAPFSSAMTEQEQRARYQALGVPLAGAALPMPNAKKNRFSYALIPSPLSVSLEDLVAFLRRDFEVIAILDVSDEPVRSENETAQYEEWILFHKGAQSKGTSLVSAIARMKENERGVTLREALALLLLYGESITKNDAFAIIAAGTVIHDGERARVPVITVYQGRITIVSLETTARITLGEIGLMTVYDDGFLYYDALTQ